MARLRTLLYASFALALCAGPSAYADYLRPGGIYSFVQTGQITLPGTAYPEWSVFNAFYDTTEASGFVQEVRAEPDNTLALCFDMPNDDPAAFLALGIRASGSDTDAVPILPAGTAAGSSPMAYYRHVKAKVRLLGGGTLPDVDTFVSMYPTVEDREDPDYAEWLRTAAKLGLVVAQAADAKSYLYVTRVRFVTTADSGHTGQYWYEFCQTSHEVTDDAGLVEIDVEFRTILLSAGSTLRAYRLYVDGVCVTDGIGYVWGQEGSDGTFDYSVFDPNSLGEGPWLFTVDEAESLGVGLDELAQIGFSANGGALASVFLSESTNAPLADRADPDAPFFAGMAYPDAQGFDLYERWVSEKGGSGLVTLTERDEAIFDEFLLDMTADPATAQRLTVTGLTVEPNATGTLMMTLTVLAPEGAVLDKNSVLCVRRAAALDGVADADPVRYAATTVSADGSSATIVIPAEEDGVAKPFLKVTAEPYGTVTLSR